MMPVIVVETFIKFIALIRQSSYKGTTLNYGDDGIIFGYKRGSKYIYVPT